MKDFTLFPSFTFADLLLSSLWVSSLPLLLLMSVKLPQRCFFCVDYCSVIVLIHNFLLLHFYNYMKNTNEDAYPPVSFYNRVIYLLSFTVSDIISTGYCFCHQYCIQYFNHGFLHIIHLQLITMGLNTQPNFSCLFIYSIPFNCSPCEVLVVHTSSKHLSKYSCRYSDCFIFVTIGLFSILIHFFFPQFHTCDIISTLLPPPSPSRYLEDTYPEDIYLEQEAKILVLLVFS